jgi:AcrR family transcriptional regulator
VCDAAGTGYIHGVQSGQQDQSTDGARPSLRAEQVAQTRAALVAAGRQLFGQRGFADTSVEEVARQARVTTGALYHHFPTKAAVFEAVFEQVHMDIMAASGAAATGARDEVEFLARAFESFLDAILEPAAQRILITDAPAVLGLARFTELDERFAFTAIAERLRAAHDAGRLRVDDPGTMARLFLGALTRGSMLIAASDQPRATRDEVARAARALLQGLSA